MRRISKSKKLIKILDKQETTMPTVQQVPPSDPNMLNAADYITRYDDLDDLYLQVTDDSQDEDDIDIDSTIVMMIDRRQNSFHRQEFGSIDGRKRIGVERETTNGDSAIGARLCIVLLRITISSAHYILLSSIIIEQIV